MAVTNVDGFKTSIVFLSEIFNSVRKQGWWVIFEVKGEKEDLDLRFEKEGYKKPGFLKLERDTVERR